MRAFGYHFWCLFITSAFNPLDSWRLHLFPVEETVNIICRHVWDMHSHRQIHSVKFTLYVVSVWISKAFFTEPFRLTLSMSLYYYRWWCFLFFFLNVGEIMWVWCEWRKTQNEHKAEEQTESFYPDWALELCTLTTFPLKSGNTFVCMYQGLLFLLFLLHYKSVLI